MRPTARTQRGGIARLFSRRWSHSFAALIFLALAAPALAEPEWMAGLRLQLEAKYRCRLLTIVQVRELTLGMASTLEGRARCADEREVDFSREAPHRPFELRLCQPAVC